MPALRVLSWLPASPATACWVEVYGEGVLLLGESGVGKQDRH
ncbi:MAG: hypothetical protein ACLRWQ_13590 [Flavonifractor plautii]